MNLSIDRKFNFKQISRALGGLALLESIFLLVSFAVAIYFSESEKWHFLLSFAIAFAVGLSGLLYGRNASSQTGKREGTVIVTCTWIVFSLLGMLPYWTSGNIPSFTNAFFETISGFTATGSSTIADVEIMPKSILFWRSMTHWIGGLGIIVISLAVLPIFGFFKLSTFFGGSNRSTKRKDFTENKRNRKTTFSHLSWSYHSTNTVDVVFRNVVFRCCV